MVMVCVKVVCVRGNTLSTSRDLPRPPRHVVDVWTQRSQASVLVQLFNKRRSW